MSGETVERAVDEWYSANYPRGVRLRVQDRASLARFVARRLGLPKPEVQRHRNVRPRSTDPLPSDGAK